MRKYTDEFLLDELKRFERENGRVPTYIDFNNTSGYPSSVTYKTYFGSWNNALQLANLKVNNYMNFDKDFLISEIHRFISENGRVPRYEDMKRKNGYPSAGSYQKQFGTWNYALEVANVDTTTTKEMLVDEIYRFIELNGHIPRSYDMCKNKGYIPNTVYKNVFGSWNNALKACGFRVKCINWTKAQLISEIYRFIDENNKIPTIKDLRGKYPSYTIYRNKFGSWANALVEADVNYTDYRRYTNDELIAELLRFVNENNRTPSCVEMKVCDGYPSRYIYELRFGSWQYALKVANLNYNNHHYHDGTETCTHCGATNTRQWFYDDKHQLICSTCRGRFWRHNNKDIELARLNRRRGYGFNPINKPFTYAHAHHLHVENKSDFVIYMPEWLHTLHYHNSKLHDTMVTPNSLAFDWWINEEFYNELFAGEIYAYNS